MDVGPGYPEVVSVRGLKSRRTTRLVRATMLAFLGAALLMGGLAAAMWFAAVPRRVSVTVERPVLRRTGEFDKMLVPTGATHHVRVARTCIAVRHVLWPSNEDAACRQVDGRNLAAAGFGVVTFVVGAASWVTSDAEPAIRRVLTA